MAKKKKNAPTRAVAAYEAHREQAAEASASRSRSGRDIAPLPAVENPARRAQAKESLEFFYRTYFPQVFNLAWSNDHRRVISKIEEAARAGGQLAIAMPRANGKTQLVVRGAIWALVFGLRQFVVLIGSDEDAAASMLETLKGELETNDLLAEDFPEACYPIRRLEGIAHRCNGQLFEGKRTNIHWTAKELVLPSLPGSIASAGIVRVAGITGRIRGMQFLRPDGRMVRPDLALIDDPQTDESARSPSQCDQRERIINGAILGLAGPGKKIAAMMPCTVMENGDLADRILDRDKNPDWNGERTKMLYRFPTRMDLWEQYAKERGDSLRAGNGGRDATNFYTANREAMDAGAEVAWSARHDPDELSALQHAMNKFFKNERAFFAEYQNEPIDDSKDSDDLTAEQVAAKVNGLTRGEVPTACNRLVAFIDIQKTGLFWTALACEDDFTAAIPDYGTYPEQKRDYFTRRDMRHTLMTAIGKPNASFEEALYAGLEALVDQLVSREWPREDGAEIRIDRILIDASWGEHTDLVYKFCRQSQHASLLMPSHGRFVGATSRPLNDYKRKRGDRIGHHWRVPAVQAKRTVRHVIFDANHYKSFAHERFRVGLGGRGCFSLFGKTGKSDQHRMFAEHFTAEKGTRVKAKDREVVEFKLLPSRPDNDFLDGVVGCCVAASMMGVSLKETSDAPRKKRERKKIADIQSAARHHRPGGRG